MLSPPRRGCPPPQGRPGRGPAAIATRIGRPNPAGRLGYVLSASNTLDRVGCHGGTPAACQQTDVEPTRKITDRPQEPTAWEVPYWAPYTGLAPPLLHAYMPLVGGRVTCREGVVEKGRRPRRTSSTAQHRRHWHPRPMRPPNWQKPNRIQLGRDFPGHLRARRTSAVRRLGAAAFGRLLRLPRTHPSLFPHGQGTPPYLPTLDRVLISGDSGGPPLQTCRRTNTLRLWLSRRGVPDRSLIRPFLVPVASPRARGVMGDGAVAIANVGWPAISNSTAQAAAWDQAVGVGSRRVLGVLTLPRPVAVGLPDCICRGLGQATNSEAACSTGCGPHVAAASSTQPE